jgi:hypothetical protein
VRDVVSRDFRIGARGVRTPRFIRSGTYPSKTMDGASPRLMDIERCGPLLQCALGVAGKRPSTLFGRTRGLALQAVPADRTD